MYGSNRAAIDLKRRSCSVPIGKGTEMKHHLLMSALVVLATICAGDELSAETSTSKILVGIAGPLTGPYAVFGAQQKRGAERAVADINGAGGVLGKQLRIEIGNDSCEPDRAERVARNLVSDGVVFVNGHFCSQSSIPAAPIYYKAGVLQITPSSSNPALTDKSASAGRTTLFRTCNRDDRQGAFAGQWLAEHFMNKRVAVVHDGSPFGRMIAGMAKTAMNTGGLDEVVYKGVKADRKDYSDLVEMLTAEKIDAIYFGGYYKDAARIVAQMREAGLNAAMFGPDSLQSARFGELAGAASDGVMSTANPDARDFSSAKKVVESMRHSGFEPEGYTLLSYAAVQVWALAANKAGTVDAAKVAQTLRSQTWDTVIGPLSFDSKGDLVQQHFTWLVFKNGKFEKSGM
jgi:branched-chain amino acid transport system substrate-binding protein